MSPTLFRREGCHLCDHAEEALRGAGVEAWESVWLDWKGELADRYGVRIPVIKRADGTELDWPFDAWTVRRFLADASQGRAGTPSGDAAP